MINISSTVFVIDSIPSVSIEKSLYTHCQTNQNVSCCHFTGVSKAVHQFVCLFESFGEGPILFRHMNSYGEYKDNTFLKCPADAQATYALILANTNSPSTNLTRNNFSFIKVKQYDIIYWLKTVGTGLCSRNTMANNTIDSIYEGQDEKYIIEYENILYTQRSEKEQGLFSFDEDNVASFSHSILICNEFYQFSYEDTIIDVNDCLFYKCEFEVESTSLTTAETLPLTNQNSNKVCEAYFATESIKFSLKTLRETLALKTFVILSD